MEMDAESRAFLDQMNALNFPPIEKIPVNQARKLVDGFAWQSTIALQAIEDISIAGPHGPIPLRIYVPKGNGPFGVLVYFHGGGWVLGSLNHKDPVCRYLADKANLVVVSVDYRLSPEHKFPVALDDCYASIEWASQNIAKFSGNPEKLAVGGDSCGGNLALASTLLTRDRQGPKISMQVAVCPVTNCNFETDSYKRFAKHYFVPREDMIWYWKQYLNRPEEGLNPYASPLQDSGDQSRLPPAFIALADFDPLHDEGLAYAKKLQANQVPTTIKSYPTFHGFIDLYNQIDLGRKALDDVAEALKKGMI